ncbi:MAG: divalent metal cation transporter [Pirellulaceae bacterium]
MSESKTFRDRQILSDAQAKGRFATGLAFLRLSGPGWLQSAITLGGGSLAGALFLGVIGGTSLLWVQIVAIIAGVIMLSAISYVTLSTGQRPYGAINQYVNPVLGVGWILATILANMIFILPQFALCFDALSNNLFPNSFDDSNQSKTIVSIVLAVVALGIVLLNYRPGVLAKVFDWLLKIIVGLIVVCFVLVVIVLSRNGQIDWTRTLWGLIPDFRQFSGGISAELQALIATLPAGAGNYWLENIGSQQRPIILSAAATAVGINMTFLLPYSMLARGWDRTFRGLAVWDLLTGMAIPFTLVTGCIVLASSIAFHSKLEEGLRGTDPAVIAASPGFTDSLQKVIVDRMKKVGGQSLPAEISEEEKRTLIANFMSTLPEEERVLAMSVVKPDTKSFSRAFVPLLGEQRANLVFGLGVLGMGFSTIVILMLINGYAIAEVFGDFESPVLRIIGAVIAVASGSCWFLLWTGASKTYLAVVASSFAVLLLPIAYFAFLLMMNSAALMGDQMPRGGKRWCWNICMSISTLIAIGAAVIGLREKFGSPEGQFVIGGLVVFLGLVLFGFSAKSNSLPISTKVKR